MNADTQAFTDRLRAELGRLDKQALVEVVIEYVTRYAFPDRRLASDLEEAIHRVRWARASAEYDRAWARYKAMPSDGPLRQQFERATDRSTKARIVNALRQNLQARESAWREVAVAEKAKEALLKRRPKLWPDRPQTSEQPVA